MNVQDEQSKHEKNKSLITEYDRKLAIENLKETNKLIRNQVITISIFTLLAIGLMYVTDKSNVGAESIGVMGVSVPVKVWFFTIPALFLVLFHNFVELTGYRARILSLFNEPLDDWKQGPHLSAYRKRIRINPGDRYYGMVSSIIQMVFLLAPIMTSFLFIFESYNLTARFRSAGTGLVLALNWLCLILLALDAATYAYRENVFCIRTVLELFIGAEQK